MAQNYSVQPGDHLAGIAARFGFSDFQTIWNHPNNAALKSKRQNPHVLAPGDVVHIPDKQQKKVPAPTTALHKFQTKRKSLMICLAVKDFDNNPLANVNCILEIDGAVVNLKTDGQGVLKHKIAATAKGGSLKIPDLEIELPVQIGFLDPVEETAGYQARLINLGYYPYPFGAEDEALMRNAIEEFQCDFKLSVTGVLDDTTRNKLKEAHGS